MAQLRYVILSSDLSTLLKGEPLPLPEDRSLDTFYLDMINKPTNGDMIKAMFPNLIFTDSMVDGYINTIEKHLIGRDTHTMYLDLDWWNAPYKGDTSR